jgi:hypothetical protein
MLLLLLLLLLLANVNPAATSQQLLAGAVRHANFAAVTLLR